VVRLAAAFSRGEIGGDPPSPETRDFADFGLDVGHSQGEFKLTADKCNGALSEGRFVSGLPVARAVVFQLLAEGVARFGAIFSSSAGSTFKAIASLPTIFKLA
jgi:hypothetical protein